MKKLHFYKDYIGALIVLLGAYLLMGHEIQVREGKKVLLLLILVLMGYQFIVIHVLTRYRTVLGQLAAISVIPLLFFVNLRIFRSYEMSCYNKNMNIIFLVLVITGSLIIEYLFRRLSELTWDKCKKYLYRHRYLFLVLAIIVITRVPYMNSLVLWDSGEYYYRFTDMIRFCDFSSYTNFNDYYVLCGHPTLAFSFIYLIGDFVFPRQIIGVSLVSLAMTLVAFWCLYHVLIKMLRGISERAAAFATLLISMGPMIYGLFAYFTPDYLLAMLFLILLYACVYHKAILASFISLCCFQTKETGLIVVGGLVIGMIAHDILYNRKDHPVKKVFTDTRLYGILVMTILQIIYHVTSGGFAQWTQNAGETAGLKWDNNGNNCLGFQPSYIVTKLKQQFILNFNWVLVVVIVAALLCYVVRHIKKTEVTEQETGFYLCELIGAFLGTLSFSCLYITSALARYQIAGDVMLYLIGISAAYSLFHGRHLKIYQWGQAVMLGLVSIQCFVTIDPVSKLAFINMDYGNQTTIYVGKTDESIHYGDYLVYNTQALGLNRIIDKFLKDVAYSPEEYDMITVDSNGACMIGNPGIYTYNWDTNKNSRVIGSNENTVPFGNCFEYGEIAEQAGKEKAILFVIPYVKNHDINDVLEVVSQYYEVGQDNTVSTLQGSISYYMLTLK